MVKFIDTGIAINLSGASVDKPKFKSSVLACLTALNASPTKLIIELTESWDMADLGYAESLLSELKTRGHPVCLDDVGAGAASIRYLRALPCNWLKIDGGFVAAAFNNARDCAILKALLQLVVLNLNLEYHNGTVTNFDLKPRRNPIYQHNINHVLFDCRECRSYLCKSMIRQFRF